MAVAGHTLMFLAVYRYRTFRSIPNLIILNLSVSDFLFCAIVIPINSFHSLRDEKPTGATCHIAGIGAVVLCIASIYTLTFASIERFMATNYPLKHRHMFHIGLVKRTLGLIWCWSALLSVLPFVTSGYVYIRKFFHCTVDWATELSITIVYLIVGNVIPLITLVYCNAYVLLAIRKGREKRSSYLSSSSIQKIQKIIYLRERRISFLILTVIATFTVCWAPYCVAMICLVSRNCFLPPEFMSAAAALTAANCCCNPIIYGVMNKNFRKAFGDILFCK